MHEERSQVAIALAGDLTEPLRATAGVLSRCDPERGGVAATVLNTPGSPMLATSAVAVCGPIASIRIRE